MFGLGRFKSANQDALFQPEESVRTRQDSLDRQERMDAERLTPGRRAILVAANVANTVGALSGQTIIQHQSAVWAGTDSFERTEKR